MKVYLVYKCSDMTEGRGPMVLDCIFADRKIAEKYIDDQPGIMGRRKKWSKEEYGDWTIREMNVFDDIPNDILLQKIKILNKLTKEEKEILGLI